MLRGRADERGWDTNHISMSTMYGTNGQMMQGASEGRVRGRRSRASRSRTDEPQDRSQTRTRGTEPQESPEYVQVLADKRTQDSEL